MKILLVDDSKMGRIVLRRLLAKAGYSDDDILEAEDGRSALSVIERDDVDLVFCDWYMPKMTGFELLQKLNNENRLPKFGFVTADLSPEKKKQAQEQGALFFMPKPCSLDAIKETLSSILESTQG